jgi:AcrR family transcriptional regulator
VGARGQRTQQRILDAALQVIGEVGYHRASVDRITRVAGCSRVSFYQYFASKEDLFRQLAGQVTRQVGASTEALDPLTADREGRDALHAWVARYAEIHARYEPIFHAYETDESLADVVRSTGAEIVSRVQSRVVTTTLPPRQLDPVIRLLLQCLNHTLGVVGVLRAAASDGYPGDRVEHVITDVLHRTLFGRHDDVNVHPSSGPAPRALEFSPSMRELLEPEDREERPERSGRALAAIVASGHDVFVQRGYHGTRVDDLVAAAGVSHGAFYRHFANKGDLARILTARAMRTMGVHLVELPEVLDQDGASGRAALRRWLRRYHAVAFDEAGMMRVWMDAALQDPVLRAELAPPLDWGRRRVAGYLRDREFGDPDMEAVVLVALLGVFGAQPRASSEIDAAMYVIERGLLGR